MDGGRKKKKRKKGKRKRSIFGRGRARLSYEDAFFTGSLSLSLSLSPCPPPSRALSFPLPRAPLPFFFGTCSQPPAEKSAPWPFDGCVKTRAQLFASSISHGVKEGRRGQRWCSLPIPQGYSPALLLLTVIFYWVYDVINLIASSTHRPNRDASETDGSTWLLENFRTLCRYIVQNYVNFSVYFSFFALFLERYSGDQVETWICLL